MIGNSHQSPPARSAIGHRPSANAGRSGDRGHALPPRLGLALGLLLAAGCSPSPAEPAADRRADALLDDAAAAARHDRFGEAVRALDQALALEPGLRRARMLKAAAAGLDLPEALDREDFRALRDRADGEAARRARERARELIATSEPSRFRATLPDLDGHPVDLADLLGRVTIVDLWGTWCPPCREELPHLAALHETTLFLDRTGTVRAKLVGSAPPAQLEAIAAELLAEPADRAGGGAS